MPSIEMYAFIQPKLKDNYKVRINVFIEQLYDDGQAIWAYTNGK